MNLTFLRVIPGMLLATVFIAPLAQAQGEGGSPLVGTWQSELTVRNCQTGAVIRTFPEMKVFGAGGTTVGTTAGVSSALSSAAIGTWRHTGGQNYVSNVTVFRFNPDGTYAGTLKVSRVIVLIPAADVFNSTNTLEIFDVQGNKVGAGCSTETGHRSE